MGDFAIKKLIGRCLEVKFIAWIWDKLKLAWSATKNLGKAVKRESKETVEAAKILKKVMLNKQPTDKEIDFLKNQSIDLGKAAVLLGLQAVPGSSIGIIAIEMFLKKNGMTMFPTSHEEKCDKKAS